MLFENYIYLRIKLEIFMRIDFYVICIKNASKLDRALENIIKK